MSLKVQIFSLICEVANSRKFILFYLTLPLGYFLQKHLTAGSFFAKTFYYWVISYSMFFNRVDVSAVGIVYGLLLSDPIQAQGIKYSGFLGASLIAFGPCPKPIFEFRFRPLIQHKFHLSERKLFVPTNIYVYYSFFIGENTLLVPKVYLVSGFSP